MSCHLGTLPNILPTPRCEGMTPQVIENGLAMAVESIENFRKGTPTPTVIPAYS